jgi:hypothetical protein
MLVPKAINTFPWNSVSFIDMCLSQGAASLFIMYFTLPLLLDSYT